MEHRPNSLLWDNSMFALTESNGTISEGCTTRGAVVAPQDSQRVHAAIDAAIEREFGREFRIVRPDGAIRILKAQSQTQRDADGKALRMIGVNIDITDRHGAARSCSGIGLTGGTGPGADGPARTGQSRVESFCHSVSHDLRAPLRHLDGFAGLLLEDCRDALSPDGLRYVDTIAAAAKKMGVLIDDLLQFSRTSRQEMGTRMVDMAVVVQEALLPCGRRGEEPGGVGDWGTAQPAR
ncbi:MAG: PAS domain-containing protein [Fibrobacteres bacterium]|nr:PAS domain-containing protein [Fibrobacterota bacterium]